MLWIVGGNELLATVLGAIPGGPDVWVASAGAILGSLAPPYGPAVVGGLFALYALTYTEVLSSNRDTGQAEREASR